MTSNTDATCTGPTPSPARVVVLMGGSMSSQYILSQLAPQVDLLAVVRQVPSRRKSLKQIWRRSQKLGWTYLADRLLLGLYTKLRLKPLAERCSEYRLVREAAASENSTTTLKVSSINDARVIELLEATKPDLVVVLGTEIIRDKVLAAAPRFVNVHAGITPLYRGSHGQFWAVVQRDWNNVGVTLHVVDRGIDTGGILGQARFIYEPRTDNLLTLLAKSAFHGSELLTSWIHQQHGSFRDVRIQSNPTGDSRLFYSPGLRDYFKFERQARELIQPDVAQPTSGAEPTQRAA